jgi:hypothetical protein
MKIIRTDNFDRSGETPGYDEKCIADNVEPSYAVAIAAFLNSKCSEYGPYFYQVRKDDYELAVFIP